MMGAAIVGMALEEMAEQEERQARPRSPRPQNGQPTHWTYVFGVGAAIGLVLFLCLLFALTSGSGY